MVVAYKHLPTVKKNWVYIIQISFFFPTCVNVEDNSFFLAVRTPINSVPGKFKQKFNIYSQCNPKI